jgi:ABC-type transporter Mla subunit MlaD
MATEASKLQVGVFVLGAAIIGAGATIWLGASRYFERTDMLVSYFSESVQGLDPGAAVKYRGVPAGRVDRITIAPDGHLIEVRMAIDEEFARSVVQDETLRAQLQLSGITGLRYVEIDRHSGDALYRSPDLSFTPPYPLIKSTPSSFKAIQEALEDIYERVMSIDVKGISSQMQSTLEATDALLRDDRIHRVLTNLAEASETAGRVGENLERMTSGIDLSKLVTDLRGAVGEAQALFNDLRDGKIGTQLQTTLQGVDAVTETTRQFLMNLQGTVERLDRTVGNLERLTDEVRQRPSRLIFSDPPADRRPRDEQER